MILSWEATGLLVLFLYLPGPGETLVWGHGYCSANAVSSSKEGLHLQRACGGDPLCSRNPSVGNSESKRRRKVFFGLGLVSYFVETKSRPHLKMNTQLNVRMSEKKGFSQNFNVEISTVDGGK